MDISPQLADQAHGNYSYIVELRKGIKRYFWILIKQLKLCRERKYWEVLGYETWASYLAQPEIDLSVHTVDTYITTYNRFDEIQLHPDGVDISKLSIIAPHVTQENATDLIEKAKTLSRIDLISEITHKEYTKRVTVCPKCGWEF